MNLEPKRASCILHPIVLGTSLLFLNLNAFLLPSSSRASDTENFDNYSVPIDKNRSKLPDFNRRDRKHRSYRTRIREGLKEQQIPNFAGRYNLIDISGTGGAVLAVVESNTGRVKFLDVVGGGPYWDMTFRLDSRLLIMQWSNGEQCRIEAYVWTGSTFKKLYVKYDVTDIEGFCQNKLEKQVRRSDSRQSRHQVRSVKIANREGSYDTGLRDLPTIDGIALGESHDEATLKSKFSMRCSPSSTYEAMRWCTGSKHKRTKRGSFTIRSSALIDEYDIVRYLNKQYKPAFFSRGEMNHDIDVISRLKNNTPTIFSTRNARPDQFAKLAVWGRLELAEVDASSYQALRKSRSPNKGVLLDHANNFKKSANSSLPVYAMPGGRAYVWIGNRNRRGIGSLRFFLIDADFLSERLIRTSPRVAAWSKRAEGRDEYSVLELPSLSEKTWRIWYGPGVVGDGILQAAVLAKDNGVLLVTGKGSCSETDIHFELDANSWKGSDKLYELFGSDTKEAWMLSDSKDRTMIRKIKITEAETQGWNFDTSRWVLRNEMMTSEAIFICTQKKVVRSRCLEFTTYGMHAIERALCPSEQ